jgi:hypothetical protein
MQHFRLGEQGEENTWTHTWCSRGARISFACRLRFLLAAAASLLLHLLLTLYPVITLRKKKGSLVTRVQHWMNCDSKPQNEVLCSSVLRISLKLFLSPRLSVFNRGILISHYCKVRCHPASFGVARLSARTVMETWRRINFRLKINYCRS